MIRYLSAQSLAQYPLLQDSMFKDRTAQFAERLKWQVHVDERGWERDDYDAGDAIYVIWQRKDGRHGGSMRFLPTTGRTMVNDHFSHIAGRQISNKNIWETTRFCLAPDAPSKITAALMLAGAEFGLAMGLSHSVGVFDRRMIRIYRALKWSPEILGTSGEGRDAISVGLWTFDALVPLRLARLAGLPQDFAARCWHRDQGVATAA